MKPARREILEKLKNSKVSLPEKPDFDEPVFYALKKSPIDAFKDNAEAINGKVYIFKSSNELTAKLKDLLENISPEKVCCTEPNIRKILKSGNIAFSNCEEIPENIEAGITGCECLVAQTGSVLVSSAQKGGRKLFIFPPIHIIIASKNQMVNSLEDAYQAISDKYSNNLPSQLLLITGPSRTADIEKTLTLGAHGPKELHILLH